jgi:hypothetical protein
MVLVWGTSDDRGIEDNSVDERHLGNRNRGGYMPVALAHLGAAGRRTAGQGGGSPAH